MSLTIAQWIKKDGIQPLPGDIFLTHGKDPLSRAIQWKSRGPWNHAGLVLDAERSLESQYPLGLQSGSLDITHARWVYLRYCGEVDHQALAEAIEKKRTEIGSPGARYDVRGIIAAALNLAFLNDPMRDYCSEVVVKVYKAAGVRVCPSRDIRQIWPQHLFEWERFKVIGFSGTDGGKLRTFSVPHGTENKRWVQFKVTGDSR